MCGILFYRSEGGVAEEPRFARALAHLRPRGPDFEDLHFGDDFVLGHTRLSIIDLSPEANQPLWDATGRYAIVYNGEIYNYRELRAELEAAGRRFRTRSDTEVLLEALLHWGAEGALGRARGMFAFALYDQRTGRLTAARDPFGQKPLYWFEDAGAIGVASDARSLLELRGAAAPDLVSYSVYLCPAGSSGTRGVFHTDRSFFDGIRMLPAGHVLEAERSGAVSVKEYFRVWDLFDPSEFARNRERAPEDLRAELRAQLRRAVDRHLVSDVEVGILLSGGIDSTLVYWMAHELRGRVQAFTKLSPGIEEIPLLVVPEVLKQRPGTTHLVVQSLEDYVPGLLEFVAHSAAPSRWGGGPPMSSLCAMARHNQVPVLLGGDCADEYWAGYEHYEAAFADPAPDLRAPGELAALDPASPFYDVQRAEGFEARERETRARIVERLRGLDDPQELNVQATLLHDTSTFLQTISLPHSDAYAMRHSVELRNPLLDLDLVRFSVNLPARERARRHASGHFGKALLRELAGAEIGPFMNLRKEGTRNYAMRMADPAYWRLERFALREVLAIPRELSKRDLIRLVNLELFHRLFFAGGGDCLGEITTEAGAAALLQGAAAKGG